MQESNMQGYRITGVDDLGDGLGLEQAVAVGANR